MSFTAIGYTIISDVFWMYVLQIFFGLGLATQMTIETTYLGEKHRGLKNGSKIGTYYAIMGVLTSVAMIYSVNLVKFMTVNSGFYIISVLMFMSAILFTLLDNSVKKEVEIEDFSGLKRLCMRSSSIYDIEKL